MTFQKIIRDPLIQFLFFGLIIYVGLSFGRAANPEADITVGRAALLQHIQNRSQNFDDGAAQKALSALSAQELSLMIDELTAEEALYREAESLGLAQEDYEIRQRMIGKMRFVLTSGEDRLDPSPEQLVDYYNQNLDNYGLDAQVSFTQVFLTANNRSPSELKTAGDKALAALRMQDIGPYDGREFGDRFIYNRYFQNQGLTSVSKQFSPSAASYIFSPDTPVQAWVGPVKSLNGLHIIYIVKRDEPRTAAYVEVANKVKADYQRDVEKAAVTRLEQSLAEAYRINIAPEVKAMLVDSAGQTVETPR